MAAGDVHTTFDPSAGSWRNKREGNQRASGTYDTKAEASSEGQRLARDTKSEWLGHRKDNGQINERNTYGKDPFPPKG
ncbi:MAG: DUF2188 domain-containing protein [Cellulomonas sp.]